MDTPLLDVSGGERGRRESCRGQLSAGRWWEWRSLAWRLLAPQLLARPWWGRRLDRWMMGWTMSAALPASRASPADPIAAEGIDSHRCHHGQQELNVQRQYQQQQRQQRVRQQRPPEVINPMPLLVQMRAMGEGSRTQSFCLPPPSVRR